VWYDEFVLRPGDSLRESIDAGLARSEFGVVILSPDFFKKKWTKRELNALVAKEIDTDKIAILPLWHRVGRREVAQFSLELADRKAMQSWEGIDANADMIATRIDRPPLAPDARLHLFQGSQPPAPTRDRSSAVEWHPAVHGLWGNSQLVWILFSQASPSSVEERAEGVLRTLTEIGSSAYEYSELAGLYDGLLKAWIPDQVGPSDLREVFTRQLQKLDRIETFAVDSVVRHWVWTRPKGHGLQTPAPAVLADRPSRAVIHQASAGSLRLKELDQLVDAGLLAQVARTTGVIDFATAVHAPAPPQLQDHLQAGLAHILDGAIEIFDPALYRGRGFADYVVAGGVAPADFESLTVDVIDPIAKLIKPFDGRTTTHPILSSKLLYRDEPNLPNESARTSSSA
jgi:hypothetical protein